MTREPVGLVQSAWILFRKDLLIEWRTRARLNALIFFAFATLLLFSFALGPDTKLLQKSAGGYLWLAILFSSTLALGESFRVEMENATLDGVRLAPTDPRAIFLGKALGNTLLLLALGLLLLPVMGALYDVSLLGTNPILPTTIAEQAAQQVSGSGNFIRALPQFALVLVLGCLAISAPGTLYSAIANNARARDVLLPLLLFPLIIPALLAAVKASNLVFQGDPMNQFNSWVILLAGFDVIYWGLGFALFPKVVED